VSTVALDVAAVRARFSALRTPTALFDGPGGTQVPDEVIDAISTYLRESNANVSGPYESSRRTEALVMEARTTAARFVGSSPDEVAFGANMSTLNFALTRTAGRKWRAGDEILVTKLDHDANVSPWLELAHDRDLVVRFVDINDDTTLDLDDLERQLSDRTRVVAFPLASNAVGTKTDAKRIVELARAAGALSWADAVHYGPHGPIDAAELGVDVLICSPYKFFGPHLGLACGRREQHALDRRRRRDRGHRPRRCVFVRHDDRGVYNSRHAKRPRPGAAVGLRNLRRRPRRSGGARHPGRPREQMGSRRRGRRDRARPIAGSSRRRGERA